MYLSDVFKYIHSFGQKGHQIGRKIGDAVELLVLGMIKLDQSLSSHLCIERGLEGATSAEHKVEFAFYKKDSAGLPTKLIDDLFGFIECKKVGVEVTIKQSFKKWDGVKKKFYETDGYSFVMNPSDSTHKRKITIQDVSTTSNTKLSVVVNAIEKKEKTESLIHNVTIEVAKDDSVLFAIDTDKGFHVVSGDSKLFDIVGSLSDCVICKIEKIENGKISSISVNECLTGPQTPEKAKQASFVSLDVRKRVLGRFDKVEEDDRMISILVLAEASHWDKKSRSMIRLCNDYNLIIPDQVVIEFFKVFEQRFGADYQNLITKHEYEHNSEIAKAVNDIIETFDRRVLVDMDSGEYLIPSMELVEGSPRLRLVKL